MTFRFALPVLRGRAVAFSVVALTLSGLGLAVPELWTAALALESALVVLVVVDAALAPSATSLVVKREVEKVASQGRAHRVRLSFEAAPFVSRPLEGEFREVAPASCDAEGTRGVLSVAPRQVAEWTFVPKERGVAPLGPLHLRLWGPLGFSGKQFSVPLGDSIEVYPDLLALRDGPLALRLAREEGGFREEKRRGDGREFDSLRDYRPGDDPRTIDWKATARRGRPMARVHRPERNQTVLLFVDCGRHMSGRAGDKKKLDWAIDASLQLAKAALGAGDQVGVVTFGAHVRDRLPPRSGPRTLNALTQVLARTDATLDDSDFGAAFDAAFARSSRRALAVVLTDVLDPHSATPLLKRLRRLAPRHVPLVVCLKDAPLEAVADQEPHTLHDAYARRAANRALAGQRRSMALMREAGTLVVHVAPHAFSAAAVTAYFDIKQRGLL